MLRISALNNEECSQSMKKSLRLQQQLRQHKSIKMDLSYNLVASKCAEQMARYQECVMANQNGDWATACRPLGQALTKCADESVPHLRELKSGCATEIMQYRSCLDKHGDQADEVVGERCGGLMKAVWTCSERVMAQLEQQQQGKGGGIPNTSRSSTASGGVGTSSGSGNDGVNRLV